LTPSSLAIFITSAGVFAIGAPLLLRIFLPVFGTLPRDRQSARNNPEL
jgi:hypothetical protein